MSSTSNRLPYGAGPPPSWGVAPLRYLADLSNGYVFNSDTWVNNGTPIIRIENLNGSENFNYSNLTVSQKHHVHPCDLLFAWSGNPGTSFGPFRWSRPGLHYLNQHIFKVTVHGCEKDWLYWALRAATHWIERVLTSGMIGMVHVTKEEMHGIPIPVPPVEVQRRITTFLDAETARIDRLAALQREVLSLLEERDRSLRDGLTDRLFADGGEVPLRRFVTRIDQGASPQCEAVPRSGHEWGVLKLSAVKRGRFISAENKRLPEDLEPQKKYEVLARDFLVTRANTPALVGDVAVADRDVKGLLLPDLIYRVGLTPELNPEFVAEVALSSRVRLLIEAVARGSSQSMVKLRGDDIREWPIPAAGEKQQEFFVREIREGMAATDKLRQAVTRQLALLAERRQALITAAVTGQIDVSTASGRGVDGP
ncbi:restriction endonuclease subunit S [Streptomyces sp. NPDC002908]|uniref:restriction endonuclease subunit S n=1 Tax=Streptomyces sp. NPDC002908 TaxID=3364670 RepID=UPI00369795F2